MTASIKLLKWLALDWQRRLHVLALTVFAYQFVEWFAVYWWPETTQSVKAVLVSAAVIEIVFSRQHRFLRFALHLAAVLWINGWVMDYHYVQIGHKSFRVFFLTFWNNFSQLTPVVWYSGGSGLALLFMLDRINSRGRAVSLLITTVIVLAGVDSFSLLILWDNEALIILSGLVLLLVQHSRYMAERHPSSWKYVTEYPGILIATSLTIIVLIIFSAVAAPNAKPLVTDPYTAWLNWKGESVPTLGKGFSGFSLPAASESGYERNSEVLGGQFNFDYTPVMRVSTDHKSYWRGEVRTVYTGKGWIEDGNAGQDAVTAVTPESRLQTQDQAVLKEGDVEETTQSVTILSKDAFPVLFGAYPISKLVSIDNPQNNGNAGQYDKVRWSAKYGELLWTGSSAKTYPKTYKLVSEIPLMDEKQLKAAKDQFQPDQWREYLQIPKSLPPRIAQLAQEITAGKTDEYDKVKAIENYLKTKYPYNNKPDVAKVRSKDFVDGFLFELKEGYCDYYSTAMAVMVRTLGIPSRWVKGYAPGSIPEEEMGPGMPYQILEKMDGGDYVVRNADAHSWVEVYFQGIGWVPFEPTAGFSMPLLQKQQQPQDLPLAAGAAVPEIQDSGRPWLIPLAASGAGLLALIVLSWFLNRKFRLWVRVPEGWRRFRQLNAKQRVFSDLNRLLKLLKRKGYARKDYETLREAVDRWNRGNNWLKSDFDKLLSVFEKIKYSRTGISEQDAAVISGLYKKMKEEL